MCAKCVDAVKESFPDIPDSAVCNFLMSCTAFPFASPSYIEEQVKKLRQRTNNYTECFGLVEDDLSKAMAEVD